MTQNTHQQNYSRLVKMASGAAIVTACILLFTKVWAWFVTGSGAVLASATDSALDLFSSLASFAILRIALQPADSDHKFGHGKAENLAGLAQSAFVMGSAFLLILHGSDLILSPRPIQSTETGIAITILAIVLTLALVLFQRYVVKKTGSIAISADSLHYKSDVLMNLGVIVALLLAQTPWRAADGVFTIAVGVYLAVGAAKIIMLSVEQLMDKELPEKDVLQIEQLIKGHKEIIGFHDIRTRQAGATRFIQFHLELDDSLSLFDAHRIGDEVEVAVTEHFAPCEVFIHFDPQSVVNTESP